MNKQNCPKHDQLAGYVQGTIPDEKAEAVAEHLETCGQCEATVEQFETQGDSLISNLRRPPPPQMEIESQECQEALARAEAIVASGAPAAEGGSVGDGRLLGEYQLLEKLGQGGMGAVYKARHTKLKRVVAIKVLPREKIPDQRAVTRFEREMEAVGQLDHPNIVRAHDAREIDGVHFLVMEYVEGQDLSTVARRGPLAIADACEMIRQAAIGLQYAHEHGLVHRDIKPSNLMLTAGGRVKILDLGLALLSSPETGKEELTTEGQPMGTADYMAPEQTTDSHSVDIRADIYSLGCTLYKLLAGRAPFHGERYKTVVQKMMAHLTEPPLRLETLRSEASPELSAIVHRMIAKKPEERFATPGEVAAALEPFAASSTLRRAGTAESHLPQADQGQSRKLPSASRAAGDTARRRSFPRRYLPWIAAAVAAAFLGGGLWAGMIIVRFKDKQGRVVAEMSAPEGTTVEISEADKPASTPSSPGRPSMADGTGKAAVARSEVWALGPESDALSGIIPRPAAIPGIHRWQVETKERRDGLTKDIIWSPDGQQLALSLGNRPWQGIRFVDAQTLQTTRIVLDHPGTSDFIWGPDGAWLASVGGEKSMRFWSPDGILLRRVPLPCAPGWMLAAPNGRTFALADGDLQLCGADGKLGRRLKDAKSCVWSPDSSRIAVGYQDGTVRIGKVDEMPGLSLDAHLPRTLDGTIAWTPDGKTLATAGSDGKIRLWQADGTAGPVINAHDGGVDRVTWSPDGRWLASCGADNRIRLWKPDGTPGATFEASRPLRSLAWSPNGHYLTGSASEWGVKIWQIEPEPKEFAHPCPYLFESLAWSPDGQRLALRSYDRFMVFTLDGQKLLRDVHSTDGCHALNWSPDGRQFAAATKDGIVRVWNAEGTQTAMLRVPRESISVAWRPDSQRLAIGSGKDVRLWEPAKQPPVKELVLCGHENLVRSLAWRPDGQLLASAGDETVRLWRPDGALEKVLAGHADRVASVAWCPKGDLLLSLSMTGELRLWKSDGTLVRAFSTESQWPWLTARFAPNGEEIVVGPGEVSKSVTVWTLEGKRLREWPAPFEGVPAVRPDGSVIATATRELHLWDQDGQPLANLSPLPWSVVAMAWSPDSRWLTTSRNDGLLHCWDFDRRQQRWLVIPFEDGTSVTLSPAGQILHGDPAVACEEQLVYVVQRTPDGPQELWTFKQFEEFVKKAGMDLWPTKP